MKLVIAALSLFLGATAQGIFAQDAPAGQDAPAPAATPAAGAQRNQQVPRPYDQVITKEAKTDEGVFAVHRIGDRVYYEIPVSELGKDFLWVTQIARTTLGAGYGGQAAGNRVVRWERLNNRVLLRTVSYAMVADPGKPIAKAVEAANNNAIIMSFNVEAFGKDDAPVIEVTRLFTSDVPEFSARTQLRARNLDANRSFVERISSFPENIEVESTQTYTNPPDGQPAPGARTGASSVVMHYSMVKLPENRMMPRLFDDRVGYFSDRVLDFGQDEHRAPEREYIERWRLEKKDPAAEISEPVKPIVYWIDPATPAKWIPYLKQGIESWQPSFEMAGFRNAIIAKDAPSPADDPEWSAEDARYSVIRWLPSTVENASGPNIHDPRTGEILDADIQMHQNVMNLIRDWYFVQVAPLDPRAATLPLPDELMGRLLMFVTAHEVGHTLGLAHNMKASSLYPAGMIRDRDWVKRMGHTPTIMDYSRFNYVAQPEDNIDVADLIPSQGPYDRWAIMWGYKPIPGAATPDDETATLGEWARQQESQAWLRFSTLDARGTDPGDLTEAVGDADAVQSSTLGMKNLQRVGDMLLKATSRPGEPYDDLQEIYGRLLGQWVLEMNHVAALIGGFDSQEKYAGQDGVRFTTVSRERQLAAVKFLNDNAFKVPRFAVLPEVLRRIQPAGVLARIQTAQRTVLANVLSNARIGRLVEQETLDTAIAYKPTDFLNDLRRGIWSELSAVQPKVDAFRRNTQRLYLEILAEKLTGRQPATDDARAFARGELRSLNTAIVAAVPKVTDRATRLHLDDIRDQIAKALDPKFVPPVPAAPAAAGPQNGFDGELDELEGALNCFPDYAIR